MRQKAVKQRQQQHLPSDRHRPHTHAHRLLSFWYPLLRNAGRRSRSPQLNTTVKPCQHLLCLRLPKVWVNLSFPAGQRNPWPLPPSRPQFVPLTAFSYFPLPPNQVKAMPSLYPHQDETKTLMSPKRWFLLRPALPKLLGNEAKIPPELLLLLLWCVALCRTCPLTTRPCAGRPSRRLRFHLLSTSGPEAGLGQPACLLLPVTPSESKRTRMKASRG